MERIMSIAVKAAIILACLALVRLALVYSQPCQASDNETAAITNPVCY